MGKWEKHTIDEPVSVLVTVTPAALVVMTVWQGTVVLLLPDMRTSPVTVKTSPAESTVVISVVGIGEGVVETMGAKKLPIGAWVVACVAGADILGACAEDIMVEAFTVMSETAVEGKTIEVSDEATAEVAAAVPMITPAEAQY